VLIRLLVAILVLGSEVRLTRISDGQYFARILDRQDAVFASGGG
jgi:hypothetical protein